MKLVELVDTQMHNVTMGDVSMVGVDVADGWPPEGGGTPQGAILDEAGDPILDEAGQYILDEAA